MINKISLALSFALLLVGCAGAPMKYSIVQEGNWRAKALIKDLEQSRSYIVNLNFNLVKNQRTRMDVTTALGTGVASMLVESKEVRYVLFDSKRFYYGPPQADVMRPILAIPFDPRWIGNVLLEMPIEGKGWSCTRDSGGLLLECRDSVNHLKVTWSARHGERKSILIEHSKASVQINVQSFKAKVEERKNLFSLEAPEGYQKLRVR